MLFFWKTPAKNVMKNALSSKTTMSKTAAGVNWPVVRKSMMLMSEDRSFMKSDYVFEHATNHRGKPGKDIPVSINASAWKITIGAGLYFSSAFTLPFLIYSYHYLYTF